MASQDLHPGAVSPRHREREARKHTHPALALAILSSASFLAALDVWITQVGLPSIGRGVNERSLSNLSWVLSAYAIVYAALLVPAGRLADRFGRKPGFLLGLAVFTAASLGAALSGGIWILVGFRAIQAAGAALMTPASLGLVLTTAPAEKVSMYVKIWFTSGALAATAGPVFGGLLVQGSWRWVFLINLPIGIVVLAAGWVLLPDTRHDQDSRIPDLFGGALLIVAIGALAFGIVKAPDWGWSSGSVITSLVIAGIGTIAFLASSSHHSSPVIELGLFRDRVFASSNAATVLFFVAFSIELLSVILWMQGHWHYSAIKVGLASAPGPTILPVFATIAENLQLKARIKPGLIAAIGLLLVGAGAVIMATRLTEHPDYVTAFLPAWLTVGAGAGLAFPTILSSATVDLRPEQTATGSAIVSMAQQIGSVVGVSVLVAILGLASNAATLDVYRHAWITSAVIAAVAIVSALGITPAAERETLPIADGLALAESDLSIDSSLQPDDGISNSARPSLRG
jgi:EmrB/QacA subfamily drug resistance transporter